MLNFENTYHHNSIYEHEGIYVFKDGKPFNEPYFCKWINRTAGNKRLSYLIEKVLERFAAFVNRRGFPNRP